MYRTLKEGTFMAEKVRTDVFFFERGVINNVVRGKLEKNLVF